MATDNRTPTADATETAGRTAVDGVSTAYQLLGEGMRTASRVQQAGSTLAMETVGQTQRFWWEQWRRMTEVGLAVVFPVSSRQLDERFEAAARQVAAHQRELRADLDRVAAELGQAQREASQTQAGTIREARREQRDGRTALEAALGQLDGRINQLAGAQGKQLDDITAALSEQEGRLRDRLGDRIRSAIESFEAATPGDLEALRGQVSALSETVTALRNELVSLTRDGRQGRADSERPEPAMSPAQPNGQAEAVLQVQELQDGSWVGNATWGGRTLSDGAPEAQLLIRRLATRLATMPEVGQPQLVKLTRIPQGDQREERESDLASLIG